MMMTLMTTMMTTSTHTHTHTHTLLQNHTTDVQCQETTRSLRSTDAPRLFVPRTRTEIAKRAFSVAAPNVWNSLPIDIRNTDCLSTFRNKLKTHFLPHLIHDETYPPQRLCILSLGGLYGALQIWFYVMLCYVRTDGRTDGRIYYS